MIFCIRGLIVLNLLLLALFGAADAIFAQQKSARIQGDDPSSLQGITHYGMPIKEIKKTFKLKDAILEVVYSKELSDDNMDKYVKRFFDELVRQIEKWRHVGTLSSPNVRIVISNCKFCKIGYCKKKNIREISLVLYKNDSKDKEFAFGHAEVIDNSKYEALAKRVIDQFLRN